MSPAKANPHFKLKSSSGFLTVDFIFSIAIASGLCAVLFAVSFAFVNVEVAQYIAFSAARAHAGSHLSAELQVEAARNKYRQLITSNELGKVFQNGWIEASKPAQIEVHSGASNLNNEYDAAEGGGAHKGIPFIGVRFNLNFKMLDFNVPFLGRTSDDEDTFTTKIAAFLIREPTYEECKNFLGPDRYDAIIELDPRFAAATPKKQSYITMEDNGC